MRLLVTLVLAMLLPACGSGGEPADPGAELTADATAGDAVVLLEPDHVVVPGQDPLQFDEADQDTATAALEAVLGAPTGDEFVAECPSGPVDAVSWGGLDLYFADGTLAGWYLDEPQPAGVSVSGGVGLGTTRNELEEAFADLTVEGSTIGTEWLGGGVSGTLSSDGEDGKVEVVWAGLTCIAR